MAFVRIEDGGGCKAYPVDTPEQCVAAQCAMREADLDELEVYAGDPDDPDAYKNGNTLYGGPWIEGDRVETREDHSHHDVGTVVHVSGHSGHRVTVAWDGAQTRTTVSADALQFELRESTAERILIGDDGYPYEAPEVEIQLTEDVAFDDAADIQSIAYRLYPSDVGRDLREDGTRVVIGPEPELRVSYPDEHGERRVMAGPRAAVVARLVALGFTIEQEQS